jgi:AcrR family transcriptional regulator
LAVQLRALSRDDRLVEERRKTIMEAAIRVFAEKSYAEATVQEIAEVAGMTIGNVYRYIGSKQDILHLICQDSKESIKNTRNILASHRCESVTETLKRTIKAYVEGSDELSDKHLFYNREIRNFTHEDRALLLQSQVEHVEFFENLIKEGIAKGEFETEDALFLAHHIVLIPHDWLLRRWFLRNHYTLEEYTAKHIEMIMKSLAKRAPATTQDKTP